MDSERALWFAVVALAVEDIQSEPLRSAEYGQAVAFFLDAPASPWGRRRCEIADYLDLHGDDLKRIGLCVVNARRATADLAPLSGLESRFPTPKPAKPAVAEPEIPFFPAKRRDGLEAVPGVYTWRYHHADREHPRAPKFNPFHPKFRRAS